MLFSFVGGAGHLQPLLPLAVAAAAAGHDVVVTGAASLGPSVARAGVPFVASAPDVVPQQVPLSAVDLERERVAVRDGFAGRMAPIRAAELLRLAADWRPDVVVRDELDFGAAIAAERLGLPAACVLVIAAGGFVEPALVAEPLNRLRAEHGLAPDDGRTALQRGLVLSPFAPGFRDPDDPLPSAARGFAVGEPPVGADEEAAVARVTARIAGRPTVYATLGTIFNTESGDLLERLLRGLAGLPVEVVATTGRSRDPAALGSLPPNVQVERYLPQGAILPHCAAVVSHAGSGSVGGALAHGLPLVCVPLGADQPRNAARCVALGVGIELDAVTAGPDDVRRATAAVLTEPRYRAAAGRLRAEIDRLPPVAEAVAALERLVRAGVGPARS